MGPSVDELLQLEVPVRVVLGQRRMTMHEVRGLLPGSVLELGTMVDEDLEVTVGHRSLATVRRCKLQVWGIPPPASPRWPKKKISTPTIERQRFGLRYNFEPFGSDTPLRRFVPCPVIFPSATAN